MMGFRFWAGKGSTYLSISLSDPLHRSNGPFFILSLWLGPDIQLERNWSQVEAKVRAQVQNFRSPIHM